MHTVHFNAPLYWNNFLCHCGGIVCIMITSVAFAYILGLGLSVCGGTMQTSPRFIAHYYIVTGHKIVPIVCTIKHVYRASLLRWLAQVIHLK